MNLELLDGEKVLVKGFNDSGNAMNIWTDEVTGKLHFEFISDTYEIIKR